MDVPDECSRRIQVYRRHETMNRRVLHFQQHEIHAVFEELIHRPWAALRWNPPTDIRESRDAFTIEMDLPGVNTDEVRILTDGKTLTIEGERRLQTCEDERTAHLCERPDGRFTRSFEFKDDVEDKEIESRWQDGVLKVIVPKSKD
jgi:HSP20 family protein